MKEVVDEVARDFEATVAKPCLRFAIRRAHVRGL
jgi:hypothetical protein